MRADRLISVLMLLQRRGHITAAEVATELEVSTKTARRDLEALAMSGVPLYSKHGRGGGWYLVGGARTDLSGLSAPEARALFMAAGPQVASTPALASAMRKLSAALPESFRDEADAAGEVFKFDLSGWGRGVGDVSPFVEPITHAIVSGLKIRIDYSSRRTAQRVRTVSPLGLVSKANSWYLVANTDDGRRTYRVSRIDSVEVTNEPLVRPATFDLDEAWDEIVDFVRTEQSQVKTDIALHPSVLAPLRWLFGSNLTIHGERQDGRLRGTIMEYHVASMAGQIAGLGSAIELIDPPAELLAEMKRITRELSSLY